MDSLTSFLPIAADSDFSLHNIPFGIFHLKSETASQARCASRLGDFVIDLAALVSAGLLLLATSPNNNVFAQNTLNNFIALGNEQWAITRVEVRDLFLKDSKLGCSEYLGKYVHALHDCTILMPVHVGDYTDFYSSKNHAFNVGSMFRGPENALQPNWTWLPVGYHGRSSSIVVSPVEFGRPSGQVKAKTEKVPTFKKSNKMDFELEMVTVIGRNNKLGEPVGIQNAKDHIFGYLLMNDVSVRDVQAWEYVPLGPFTGKNCITVVSPWIVTALALEPFRVALPPQDPAPLEYLADPEYSTYDLPLEVHIQTEKMSTPQLLSTSNMKYLYWTPNQQLTHHTVTGCNLQIGDMLGSGTISGTTKEEYGSFLELSWNGKFEMEMEETKEKRKFWEDGDKIILKGTAVKGNVRVGFGECLSQLKA